MIYLLKDSVKFACVIALVLCSCFAFTATPQDPPPPPNNNGSTSNLAPQGGVSGGGGSGVESNGALASHIALRNFNRIKSDAKINYDDKSKLVKLSSLKQGNQFLRNTNATDLINFLPETSSNNTIAHITSPLDLLGITNAKEIFAVDYFNQTGRMAAILATSTENEIYEHTKVICDRKSGAKLDDISYIYINGHSFILSKIIHINGVVEYSSGFTAYVTNGDFEIDNHWTIDEFEIRALNFNFQVWSHSASMTQSLIKDIITLMSTVGNVTYNNIQDPDIPQVYVESAYYSAGKLHMNIRNNKGATMLILDGSKTISETSQRESVYYTIPLNGSISESISVNTNGIFDIGVKVSSNITSEIDVVYFSDGSWGVDFLETGAIMEYYEVFEETSFNNVQYEFPLERDVYIKGKVKNYVSLYRELPVTNPSVNLNQYNAISLNSYGSDQEVLITLVDPEIELWADQFRYTININANSAKYTIPFNAFSSLSGITLNPDKIVSVVFSITNDGINFRDFSLSINNFKYINTNAFSIEEMGSEQLKSFPNPFTDYTNVYFVLDKAETVSINIFDLTGKLIVSESKSFNPGLRSYTFYKGSLRKGVYLFELTNSKRKSITKLVIQ